MSAVNRPSGDARTESPLPAIADELLSAVAHELKTPLGVIAGYAELLRLRDDADLRNEGLARIEEAAKRLGLAIDDLLTVVESDSSGFAERFLSLRDHVPESRAPLRLSEGGRRLPESAEPIATRRILVVDDDDEIRGLLVRTLPTDGFELLEARDGREALALVEERAPDLIVLDWNMPNATGGDVIAELSRRELTVPVIVLTADDEPVRRRVAAAHGTAFLAKPFSPLELLSEIERLLD